MSLSITLAGAIVDEDLVLLDIPGDAYHCLPEAAAAWADLEAGRDSPDAAGLAAQLREAGLRAGPRPAPPPDLPQRSHVSGAAELRPMDLWRLFCAWVDLQTRYNGRAFEQVLRAARPSPAAPARQDPDDPELARLVSVFLWAAVWIPADRKCLVRSFLLLRFLQRSGRDARWVFGVRTWPFVAHCWLQVGDRVLDDERERLAAYTPIHAV
ncbi:MAG: lasso peptide biosynthesis B2 protein [Phenylobacterium zucineum]|nr:MAG: lasso peptide biosynthesis B2 protein [Phenylobacterium zucineum]